MNAAERRRKAHAAAAVRNQMASLRRARMHTVLAEADRKRAMHDAVRAAAIDGPAAGGSSYYGGFGGGSGYHGGGGSGYYGGGGGHASPQRERALGYELDGVRRVHPGGNAGYSTDDGRPHGPPRGRQYEPERDGYLFETFSCRGTSPQWARGYESA